MVRNWAIGIGLCAFLAVLTAVPAGAQGDLGAFPRVEAENLDGVTYRLPGDFTGRYNIVLLAFDTRQQRDVDRWVQAMDDLFSGGPGLQTYQVTVAGRQNAIGRFFIDRQIRSGEPEAESRRRAFTVFEPQSTFLKSLNLPSSRRVYVLVVSQQGTVLHREDGVVNERKLRNLASALNTAIRGGLLSSTTPPAPPARSFSNP